MKTMVVDSIIEVGIFIMCLEMCYKGSERFGGFHEYFIWV